MSTRSALRVATRRYWLTPEEIEMYGVDQEPERMHSYLSFNAWEQVVRRPLNTGRWGDVLDNKWMFGKVFRDLGVPVPQEFGVLHPQSGRFEDGLPLRTMDDLSAWLDRSDCRAFVLKPVMGWAGAGVVVVDKASRSGDSWTFCLADGTNCDLQGIHSRLLMGFRGLTGYLLQERLWPSRWVRDFTGGGPGGFRIVTLRGRHGDVAPIRAVMRAGTPNQMSESFASGSLIVPVQCTTGLLGVGRTREDLGSAEHDRHPGSGQRLAGSLVPLWRGILQSALRAAERLPGLACVCWDVILTDKGPVVLEGNTGFQIQTFQFGGKGFLADGTAELFAELGSDLPDGSRAWVRRNTPSVPRRLAGKITQWERRFRKVTAR